MPMVHTAKRHFRPLSDLNLIDNFLFHEMLADKENGEEFCRILLKTIRTTCYNYSTKEHFRS